MKYFIAFVLVMNIITFFSFGMDKYKAVKGSWRISEATLLLMSLCFGSVGQLAGMKVFRHKTQKWYFWLCGVVFLVIHAGLVYVLFTKILL